jgi:hypothetical protein
VAGKLYSFRESAHFTRRVTKLLSDDEYAKLQERLTDFPNAGDLIKGSGGLRKIRQAAKGKGSRGGSRVIYYFPAAKEVFYMLDLYAKNEMEYLSKARIKELLAIVAEWREK